MALTEISIRGAREHNLKDVNIDIPRDELVVITGLSGSGKSSMRKVNAAMWRVYLLMHVNSWK
jgi:excinuclease UvrABC ATPase subunit